MGRFLKNTELKSGRYAVQLPIGSNTVGPDSPVTGLIRFNQSTNQIEYYNSGAWNQMTYVGNTMQITEDNYGVYLSTSQLGGTPVVTTFWSNTGAQVSNIANITVSSSSTPTVIDTVNNDTVRTAKYIIQATNGAVYQSSEVLVVANATTATHTTYGTIVMGANLGVISAIWTAGTGNGNTNVYFTSNIAGTTSVRIKKDYINI